MSKLALRGGKAVRTKPFPNWPCIGKNDIPFITNVLQKGLWWRGMGKENNEIEQFESLFAEKHDLKYGLAIVNGTVALNTAMQAMDFESKSEVIVTPYTYVASAFCIIKAGLNPVFADISQETYNIDPLCIEQAITERTKGIVLVHFGGAPVDYDRILPLAHKYKLRIIEDCAHAHGAEWRGSPVGSWGDIACFSFHAAKNLTCGEGGFIATSNEEFYEKCWMIHNMGRKIGGEWYEHRQFGENLRFNPMNAALLLSQYQDFEKLQTHRKRNMDYFRHLLINTPFLEPLLQDERVTKHGLHLFICRYQSDFLHGVLRHRFVTAIQAEGIPCHVGYKFPLYFNKPLEKFKRDCVNAEKACFQEAIWFDHRLFMGTQEDVDDIFNSIIKIKENIAELSR
jgi:dTDP-4-amino-4,6-dideoxygalactose transaminase